MTGWATIAIWLRSLTEHHQWDADALAQQANDFYEAEAEHRRTCRASAQEEL